MVDWNLVLDDVVGVFGEVTGVWQVKLMTKMKVQRRKGGREGGRDIVVRLVG